MVGTNNATVNKTVNGCFKYKYAAIKKVSKVHLKFLKMEWLKIWTYKDYTKNGRKLVKSQN